MKNAFYCFKIENLFEHKVLQLISPFSETLIYIKK